MTPSPDGSDEALFSSRACDIALETDFANVIDQKGKRNWRTIAKVGSETVLASFSVEDCHCWWVEVSPQTEPAFERKTIPGASNRCAGCLPLLRPLRYPSDEWIKATAAYCLCTNSSRGRVRRPTTVRLLTLLLRNEKSTSDCRL